MKPNHSAAENVQPPEPFVSRIRKRDGRVVPFDATKISAAILKAGRATGEFGEEDADTIMLRVLVLAQSLFSTGIPTVEEVQDLVEEVLLASPFKRTAKAYILYRDQHARNREIVEKADVLLIHRYMEQLDWMVRENSNTTFSLQGLNNRISSKISQTYWLNQVYSSEIGEAHRSGDLHVHDLGSVSVYCIGLDLRDLLLSGFRGASGKTESRPPRHFRTALNQMVNCLF